MNTIFPEIKILNKTINDKVTQNKAGTCTKENSQQTTKQFGCKIFNGLPNQ